MPDAGTLTAALRPFLPREAEVVWADPTQQHLLLPGEALPGAVPARLREFSAGRHAARQGLTRLGQVLQPIPMGDDRAPIWPDGFTGSITHTKTDCLAIVAPTRCLLGVGVDMEPDDPLPYDLWDTILRPEEQIWLSRQPVADRGTLAKIIFSAKEAAYKAQYPLSQSLFGFDTLELSLTPRQFSARFQQAVSPFAAGDVISGHILRVDGAIVTLALIPA